MRTSFISRRHLLAGSAAVALASTRAAHAQADWPSRPVRVIVPYPPGGGADTVSRILFAKLSEKLAQQFIIDNRGGAGGTIGAAVAAKADPDGYTILYDGTAHSVNPFLYPRLPYDTAKDFAAVFLASLVPNLLVANNAVTAKTIPDVIALAKATPGGLNFASAGNGTLQHLSMEMLKHRTGAPLNHVPYRGGGPALNDVISGHIPFFFSNGSSAISLVQSGTLKAIAHTGRGRLGTLPDLPAVAETLPGFEAYEWNGVFVPAGTSPAIIAKLNAALNALLEDPYIVERFKTLNVESRQNTPDEFRAFVTAQLERWGQIVKDADIKLGG